jgi:hypothetical protein
VLTPTVLARDELAVGNKSFLKEFSTFRIPAGKEGRRTAGPTETRGRCAMVRLNVENLETREVPAAGLLSAATATPVVLDFTPPIGSNKGSFASDGLGASGLAATARDANGIIAILIGD